MIINSLKRKKNDNKQSKEKKNDNRDQNEVVGGWIYEDKVIESSHSYQNGINSTRTIYNEKARSIGVYFENIQLEENKDFLYIKDAAGEIVETLTGNIGGKIITVNGNVMNIQLSTDDSGNDYGYNIYKTAFYYDNVKEYSKTEYSEKTEETKEKTEETKEKTEKTKEKTDTTNTESHDDIRVDKEQIGWNSARKVIESNHNYSNNINDTKVIRREGSLLMGVYFRKIYLEENRDYLYILDKEGEVIEKLTGKIDGYVALVEGDTVKLELRSDDENNDYGYEIYQISYYLDSLQNDDAHFNDNITEGDYEIGWNYFDEIIDSSNFDNNRTMKLSKKGAKYVAVYFEKVDIGQGEKICIYDESKQKIEEITGSKERFIVQVKGSEVNIDFENKNSNSDFKIIKVAYYFE